MIHTKLREFRIPGRRRLIKTMLGGLAARQLFGQGPGPSQSMDRDVFENGNVRAVRFRFQPRTVRPMHQVAPSLMVYITDSATRFTSAAGETWEENLKAGEVRWWPGGRVRTEILSNHWIEFIQVVPK